MEQIDFQVVQAYLDTFPDAVLDFPFGEDTAVYSVDATMFALATPGKLPVRLSLRCDPQLSKILRDKYESVMLGQHLNKKQWITVVLSGQLDWEEVQGLIRHSYLLATGVHELPHGTVI